MTRSGGGGIIERKNVLIREKVHSGVSPADAARIAAWGIRLKVLWLCNIMLPVFAKANGLPCTNREGWLSGSFDRIVAARRERERAAAGAENVAEESGSGEHVPHVVFGAAPASVRESTGHLAFDDTSDLHLDLPDLNEATGRDALGDEARYIDLAVCCPVPAFLGSVRQEVDGVIFYGFREDLGHPEHYDPGLEEVFADILQDYRPDIVHIFGTEFPHTLAMTRAFRNPGRTLIGIQGLCCSIADAYMADLPYRVQRRATFRDRVRRDSLRQQQAKFVRRAAAEAAALRLTGHVTGRTELDRRETGRINPEALYHPMNETMRRPFYAGQWDTDRAEPYSIFVGQGDYPLKGLHYMLQAMPDILAEFPKAKLYVAGISVIGPVGGLYQDAHRVPEFLRITSYGIYLRKLIRDLGLEGHVFMTGPLSAEAMKQRFLDSQVFVCPSIMENSPNSLCEAMLLGMPVVAARVGGIPDLITDRENGLLFPGGDPKRLAACVNRVLGDRQLAFSLGHRARRTARVRHNPDTNFKRLVEIYRSMMA